MFPLLDRGDLAVRRPGEAALCAPVRLIAGTPVLERYRSARLIHFRSFTIDVELGGYQPGEEGVLVAHGDPFGGYLLVVENGLLHVVLTSCGRIGSAAGPLRPRVMGAAPAAGSIPIHRIRPGGHLHAGRDHGARERRPSGDGRGRGGRRLRQVD